MSPEAQRIAIAEACGWKWYRIPSTGPWAKKPYRALYHPLLAPEYVETLQPADMTERMCNNMFLWREGMIPDYTDDLNAMHEAEMTLHWEQENENCPAQEYYEHLIFVCGRNLPKAGMPYGYVCHLCGEQIYDSQATESSDDGMIHANCPEPDCYDWHLVTATAAQRAEAFLRTKGLWKD